METSMTQTQLTKTRNRTPIRHYRARSDGSVGALCRTIAEDYGLPPGSVSLVGPEGRALRADAYVATLRKRYD